VFGSISKALAQLGDPKIQKLIGITVVIALAIFAILGVVAWWLVGWAAGFDTWWAEALQWLGVAAVVLVSWFTFPAVAAAISAIFADRVIDAVEARYYPGRPAPYETSVIASILDGLKLALLSLVINLLALPFLFFVITAPIYFAIVYVGNGYLLGREYYEMPAFRRLQRPMAKTLYRAHRGQFTLGGVLIAILSTIPIVNLIAPILATAFMVHLFESVVKLESDRAASVTRRPPSGAN
jgi:uncharacterized protein involved in cysteine biosynthesis